MGPALSLHKVGLVPTQKPKAFFGPTPVLTVLHLQKLGSELEVRPMPAEGFYDYPTAEASSKNLVLALLGSREFSGFELHPT